MTAILRGPARAGDPCRPSGQRSCDSLPDLLGDLVAIELGQAAISIAQASDRSTACASSSCRQATSRRPRHSTPDRLDIPRTRPGSCNICRLIYSLIGVRQRSLQLCS